jgi:predicted Rossmann-fold nucleotide-binding protein
MGQMLARREIELVYGGSEVGLMGDWRMLVGKRVAGLSG